MGVADIFKVYGTGRLTRNSELTYTQSGCALLKFSLAYSRSIKKGDGWEQKSCFINCTMFGKRAESLSEFLVKGKHVMIEGSLDHQTWEKDGEKKSCHAILVDNIIMASDGKKGNTNSSAGKEAQPQDNDFEYDVPF